MADKPASIYKTELELALIEFCEGHIAPLGFRVVDLDCRVSGKSLLRLFVEEKKGEKQISIEDCVRLSRLLEPLLEQNQFFSGAYELEVSSPGLDRRLRLLSDFTAFLGKEVKLEFCEAVEGMGKSARGLLKSAQPEALELNVSGKDKWVNLNNIKKAHTVWQFKFD